jgi:hypothetical protein
VLVLHVIQTPIQFVRNQDGHSWAPEIECLIDLVEMGYTREAMDMISTLSRQRLAQAKPT